MSWNISNDPIDERICSNPHCRRHFRAVRHHQKFCTTRCGKGFRQRIRRNRIYEEQRRKGRENYPYTVDGRLEGLNARIEKLLSKDPFNENLGRMMKQYAAMVEFYDDEEAS